MQVVGRIHVPPSPSIQEHIGRDGSIMISTPGWRHLLVPGVTPADYISISTPGTSLRKPHLTSANEIAHKGCGRSPVIYNFG